MIVLSDVTPIITNLPWFCNDSVQHSTEIRFDLTVSVAAQVDRLTVLEKKRKKLEIPLAISEKMWYDSRVV